VFTRDFDFLYTFIMYSIYCRWGRKIRRTQQSTMFIHLFIKRRDYIYETLH
jgi:hypothetical protein